MSGEPQKSGTQKQTDVTTWIVDNLFPVPGLPPDARSLWYQTNNQDKELHRKRQWLMGSSKPTGSNMKRLKSNWSMLPETMLREDDLFYESLKKNVEKGFGVCDEANELQTTCNVDPFVQLNIVKTVLAKLNDFTNHGLCVLATVIGGSSDMFEKTRCKMKKFIKGNIPKECSTGKEAELYGKLCQILKDPCNFQKNCIMESCRTANKTISPTMQSHYDAIKIVLRELKGMSLHTLCVMYRRLKGVEGSLPTLSPSRTGWNKSRLVKRIESLSLNMIAKLDKGDELPVALVKAMEVACLSLKLSNRQNASIINFCDYGPEIETLHNEIVKAISLLNCKVGVQELKELMKLLAQRSNYEVNIGLRKVIKKMLTEFLFEISEMDETPILLLDTLAVIKSCALRQKEVTEEVECILNVSAQVKQVLWDSVADHELDSAFCDAYMEDLEESDVDELFDDDDSEEEEEELSDISEVGSTAEDSHCAYSNRVYCTPIWDVNNMSAAKSESGCKTEIKVESHDLLFTPSVGLSKSFTDTTSVAEESKHGADTKDSIPHFSLSSNPTDLKQERKFCQRSCKLEPLNFLEDSENPQGRNKYLSIQHACDETSLIAYRLIGQVLEGYARFEELDLDQSQLLYLNDGNLPAVDLQDEDQSHRTASTDDVDTKIIIQAVRELIPSFPHSDLEKVSKILR